MNTDQLVTLTQAAKILGFNKPELFYYYLKRDNAPKSISIGGKRYWNKADIETWDYHKKNDKPLTKGETDV